MALKQAESIGQVANRYPGGFQSTLITPGQYSAREFFRKRDELAAALDAWLADVSALTPVQMAEKLLSEGWTK